MIQKKDISYYNQLNYDIITRKLGNFYYLLIPELNLIVESEDLCNGFEKLEEKKKLLFSDMINAKAEDIINEPISSSIKNSFSELPLFCIKTLIVFFLFASLLSVIFIGTLPLANSIINRIPRGVVASSYAFANKVNTKLATLSDEDKQKLRIKYRKILHEIKPFVDETRLIFEDMKKENDIK